MFSRRWTQSEFEERITDFHFVLSVVSSVSSMSSVVNLSRTLSTSLSPRPERFTIRISSGFNSARDFHGVRDCVRRFQRRNDSFQSR